MYNFTHNLVAALIGAAKSNVTNVFTMKASHHRATYGRPRSYRKGMKATTCKMHRKSRKAHGGKR